VSERVVARVDTRVGGRRGTNEGRRVRSRGRKGVEQSAARGRGGTAERLVPGRGFLDASGEGKKTKGVGGSRELTSGRGVGKMGDEKQEIEKEGDGVVCFMSWVGGCWCCMDVAWLVRRAWTKDWTLWKGRFQRGDRNGGIEIQKTDT